MTEFVWKNMPMQLEQIGNNLILNVHPAKFTGECPLNRTRHRVIQNGFMTSKDYAKTLKRKADFLHRCNFDNTNCKFLTLNTKNPIKIDVLIEEFKIFTSALRRKFGNFEYIRALECYRKGADKYHIHAILVFEGRNPQIAKKALTGLWTFGDIHIEDVVQNEVYNVVQYITNFKENNLQIDQKSLTKFPKGCKIISTSRGIRPNESKSTIEIDRKLLSYLIDAANKNDVKMNTKGHYYGDKLCIDKMFFTNVNQEFLNLIADNFSQEIFNVNGEEKMNEKQLDEILGLNFPDKTIEEIKNLPIEEILADKQENECLTASKKRMDEILLKTHNDLMQEKNAEKTSVIEKLTKEQLEEKICSFCENAQISMSALQRVFKISFPFASRIVDLLLDKGIISTQEIGYNILDNIQLKTELQNQLKHLAE